MGLVTSSRGGSETRPAGPVAGLPGAGCPGSGSVVRYHEARDRTEPWALKASGKSRGRAPRGERASQKGRAPRGTQGKACISLPGGARGIYYAPFGAPPPFFWRRPFVNSLGKPRGANKKRSARTTVRILTRDSGGGGPREAWWRGRLTRSLSFDERDSSRPAPLPPSSACFASSGWSPLPAIAGREAKARRADQNLCYPRK
jgi:hypothetical protein